jgi:PAS domain S-box-containing protein
MNDLQQDRVLIVDDNPNNLKVLLEALEKVNYKVLVAESGASALKRIEYLNPDIILLDVMMPDLDGFETCRRLKAQENSRDIPVIFMTALSDIADKIKGFEEGAVDYVVKPLQIQEVLLRLKVHLTIYHLQKQRFQQNKELKQEIIKRKHAEEQLRQFARAVEQSGNAIMITNTEGYIQFVNPAFSVKTGYSSEEVIGQKPNILNSGQQDTNFYKKIWYALQHDYVWKGEILNKCKNGELYWTLETISPIKNEEGDTTHYLAIQEDITERKRLEKMLHKFSEAVKQSGNIISITDLKGTIEFVNQAFSTITGYSYEEAIGKTPKILNSGKQTPEFYKNLWTTIQRGKVWQGELINKRKNEELFWVWETISPIKDQMGKTTNFLVVQEDITERKHTEEKLRKFSRVIEQSANVIVITDLNGKIEFVNPVFSRQTGYSPSEAIGQNPRLLKSGKHPAVFYKTLWTTLKNGNVWKGEMQNKRKNGELFWEFATISPIKNKTGQVTHYAAIKEDITERKRVNKLIRQLFGRYLSDEVVKTLLENESGPSLGGERREITILTSDIRGFTAQAEKLLPEEVIKIINHYFTAMIEVITQYQGTINEFMGDAILVLFGAPIARKDDVERAVACAIAMQLAMQQVNQQIQAWGFTPLEMGIGVNTGEVVVGNIGSEKRTKYGVVGNEVNLTYRIESYSTGGQILISEATLKKISHLVKVQSEKTVKPKGVTHPIHIYEVEGIGPPYNLSFHQEEEIFWPLPKAIPFLYTIIEGKHIGSWQYRGHLLKLSAKSALIHCDVKTMLVPEVLKNLKLNFFMPNESKLSEDIYVKVISQANEAKNLYIQFTSVPMSVKALLVEIYESLHK